MKKVFFFLILYLLINPAFSQCDINPFITENYTEDAWAFVFREFITDPTHPNYDVPIINEEETIPYLEKLSGVYNEIPTNETIDSLFNFFSFHINEYVPNKVVYGKVTINVPEETDWVQDFEQTGISGVPELDNLMTEFQFEIIGIGIVEPPPIWSFELVSSIPHLNPYALIDDFTAINGIAYSEIGYPDGSPFNYTGEPFEIEGEPVVAVNIFYEENTFTFTLHTQGCFNTCPIAKAYVITLSDDCEVLSVETLNSPEITSKSPIAIYPNPVKKNLFISNIEALGQEVTVYDAQGKSIEKFNLTSKSIDLSSYTNGVYFLKIKDSQGTIYTKQFIKL